MRHPTTRREFLASSAALAGGLLLQDSKPRKLAILMIGVSGRGGDNLEEMKGENVAALCDVDRGRLQAAAKRFPGSRCFSDFREALALPGLDAAVISTPDHTHAFAAVAAMKAGLHVFCEKPLARTVHEARRMAELAREKKLATQMGIQIHAEENYHRVVETVRAGTLGQVREVHVFCNDRNWTAASRPSSAPPVPADLDWDLWLGPAAQRPYHSAYHPAGWRCYWDFGGGTLADMACHLMDLAFWALDLRYPTSVQAMGPDPSPETAPPGVMVRYEFPARGALPPVRLTWYDGDTQAKVRRELGLDDWKKAVLFVGDKGWLISDYGRRKLGPAELVEPKPSLPKSVGHHQEWLQAIRQGTPTSCDFAYSGPLTEAVLLGIVSHRAGNVRLKWDWERMTTGVAGADAFLRQACRRGWELG
jgi:predicted dehydrogenase